MKYSTHVIALSGGIATGKSTCVDIFKRLLPDCVVFDADLSVKGLYGRDDVQEEILEYFGSAVLNSDGQVDKASLRQRAFADPSARGFLEEVFHPRVREECLALLQETVKKGASRLFVADIPLLFENGFDFGQSINLLVATRRQTQVERLKNRNGWSDKAVQAAISAQMPLENKIILADVVFWNEGPRDILENQCLRYLRSLQISE